MKDLGKFYIDGKEIEIDYSQEIDPKILKALESSPMTQYDAYMIRKRMHQFANVFDTVKVELQDDITKIEGKVDDMATREISLQKEIVPVIATKVVHEIVNGKFLEIKRDLDMIKKDQHDVREDLALFNNTLMSKIDYITDKTLFGAIKKNYETKPLRTIFLMIITGFLFGVIFFQNIGITSVQDLVNLIKSVTGIF